MISLSSSDSKRAWVAVPIKTGIICSRSPVLFHDLTRLISPMPTHFEKEKAILRRNATVLTREVRNFYTKWTPEDLSNGDPVADLSTSGNLNLPVRCAARSHGFRLINAVGKGRRIRISEGVPRFLRVGSQPEKLQLSTSRRLIFRNLPSI